MQIKLFKMYWTLHWNGAIQREEIKRYKTIQIENISIKLFREKWLKYRYLRETNY